MFYIPRIIENNILSFLNSQSPPFNTLLLGGARQTGKSTLLRNLFPQKHHCHINLSKDLRFANQIDKSQSFEDFSFIIQNEFNFAIGGKQVLIIDEAQLSKKLGAYVRFFKEEWKTQKVILTGSTLSHLFQNHPKPTGRVSELVLRPFNFLEFLQALDKTALLDQLKNWSLQNVFSETIHTAALEALQEYLLVGGLPEVVLRYKQNKTDLKTISNIYAYYKKDFVDHLDLSLSPIFEQCFVRIAASTGAPIKNSSIIKSSSPGYRKVADVLSLLESWHLILKLNHRTSKLSQTGSLTPKRFIFDLGIRRIQDLARFSQINLFDISSLTRSEIGGILENFAMTELLSLNLDQDPTSWSKTHQSGHVDFTLQHNNSSYAIEIKTAHKFNKKHLSGLKTYHQFYPNTELILCNLDRGGKFQTDTTNILNVPIYALYIFLNNKYYK